MDIVTIFADKDGNDIFLDIEVKNGELSEVSNKLSAQLNKRIESKMNEFLKSGKYLLIGLVNDSFFASYFNDENKITKYKDIESLLENAKNFIPEKKRGYSYLPKVRNGIFVQQLEQNQEWDLSLL